MFDINALITQYNLYTISCKRYKDLTILLSDYFKKHHDKLKVYLDEYYSIDINDDASSKDYIRKHDVLNRYFQIKFIKEYYESKKKEYKNDISQITPNSKIVYMIDEQSFFDLVTEESIEVDLSDKQLTFIISLLKKANVYIGEIYEKETTLLQNILEDIKNKNSNQEFTNKEVFNEYTKTKNSKSIVNNKIIYQHLKKLIENAEKEYKDNKIDYDEYMIIKFMLVIVNSADIDLLYDSLNDKDKGYLIKAYMRLSSYAYYKDYQISYRSLSERINNKVKLIRNKKRNR